MSDFGIAEWVILFLVIGWVIEHLIEKWKDK